MLPNSSSKSSRIVRLSAVIGYPVWAALSAFLMGPLIAYMAFYGLFWLMAVPPPVVEDSALLSLIMMAAMYMVGLMVLLTEPLTVRLLGRSDIISMLGLQRWPRLSDLVRGIVGWLAYFGLTLTALYVVDQLVPGYNGDQSQDIGFENMSARWEDICAFIALVVIAPIVEEIIFRGYLYSNLRRHITFGWAAIITSALFGFVHQQWNVAIDVFILSVFACYLREKTGAIWGGVVIHMLKNAVAYYFLFVYSAL